MSGKKIDLLIPTRARVARLYELLTSIKETVSDPQNIAIYFYVDNDDFQTIEAESKIKSDFNELSITFLEGERIVLSNMWNKLWEISNNAIIMHCGDDLIFRSKNWDSKVIAEFDKYPDEILLVYGRDGIQNALLATHSFTSRKATNLTKWFVPPYFACDYNDTWLDFVYKSIDRARFLHDVFIDHMHFGAYYQLIDDTYSQIREGYDESTKLWIEKEPERNAHIKLLLENSMEYSKQKIKEFAKNNPEKSIYLWGAGDFAKKFLKYYDLSELNIKGIIDRNAEKTGFCLNGYEIFHTDKLKELNPDIILLSVLNKEHNMSSILINQIKKQGLKTEVIPYIF